MSRRRWNTNPAHHHTTCQHGDSGMTLIEVIVAMGLFLVLMTSSTSILLVSLKTTAVNRDRVGAANVAGRELEIIRDQFNSATRGPATISLEETINQNPLTGAKCFGPACPPIILDNVHYTVTRNAKWVAIGDSSAVSKCDEGTSDALDYLRVNVKVSWGQAGKSISMDTFLTPPKGTHPEALGQIGVKLKDAAGKPVAGPVLTIVGPSGTLTSPRADNDGCTVITDLLPGSYEVTVNEANYVTRSGTQSATRNANVLPGAMKRVEIDYDLSARVVVTFAALVIPPATPPTTYHVPTDQDIPVSFGNEGLAGVSKTRPSDPTQPIIGLWPFPSGYQLWAGNCLDADPLVTSGTTGLTRSVAVSAVPGLTTYAIVDLAPLTITGAPEGSTVTAVHAIDTSCQTGDTIPLGTITGGKLDTSAPYGNWKLEARVIGPPLRVFTTPAATTLVRDGQPVTVNLTVVP